MKRLGDTYPWRDGNRSRLLVDGAQFFPAMLEAIDRARQCIWLELYLIESGTIGERFIDRLCAATGRGVEVLMLLDDYGAGGLNRTDRQRLSGAGVQLSFYNPLHYGRLRRNLFRDHRKLLLVDQRTAYVGGVGLTDAFARPPEQLGWHETVLEVRGPVVADWARLFAGNWRISSGRSLETAARKPSPYAGGLPGRVARNAPTRKEISRSLIKRLRNAERRAWISTAYFLPSWKVRRSLKKAVKNGADVRLLLPGPYTDHPLIRHAGRRFYARLLDAGVRIFEYQPRFLHAKAMLCDDWLSVGSCNIDRWNLRWNLEANQELEGRPMAETLGKWFERAFDQAEEICPERWHYRPWHRRLLERLTGWLDVWFDQWTQRWKE